MRSNIRISFLVLAVSAVVTLSATVPAASAAGFGIEKFFAGNCSVGHEACGTPNAKEGTKAEAEAEGFLQAGGYVPFGVTDFVINKVPAGGGVFVPAESIKSLRVDVAPGVVTNPQSVAKCSQKEFTGVEFDPVGHPGIFTAPKCPEGSVIGKNEVETVSLEGGLKDVKLSGKVYNLEQTTGQGSTYGVALEVGGGFVAHTIIQGSVEYASDYHDYFVITNIPPGLLESRLVFYGAENPVTTEKTTFIRNPTKCTAVGPETTTTDTAESETGVIAQRSYTSLVGGIGCAGLKFEPTFALTPETNISDQPDGVTAEAKEPHPAAPGPDSADLETISIKMPEGLTMNPSASAGLEGCTPEQAATNKSNTEFKIAELQTIGCPSGSRIGTVNLEVPTLPAGSLKGPVYLGKPAGKSIEGPPYTIYLDPESSRYGQRVLLTGTVTPNPVTGQLTVAFNQNPQAPFNSATVHFNGGAFAPIANPVVCGNTTVQPAFTAFSGAALTPAATLFGTVGCISSPPPFALSQSTSVLPTKGGAESNFTFTLTRPQGVQYVSTLRTVLPPGVAGKIPTVTPCAEAQANAGTCPSASFIGTVKVTAGSGEPYPFSGNVYLTEHYAGAPYGLSFVVPVVAGPFNLGTEVTRAKIEVEPYSGRVVVTSTLPTIRAGIPTRLRSLTVNVSRPDYLLNPTNCAALATESTATSTLGATALISSPFQAEGCSSLAFKPQFKAATTGKTSKANGASLETTINMPSGGANVKSVVVQLPKQLPSRLTTLQKACLAATFEASPSKCPAASIVGGARANTTLLPGKLQGNAYYVSHGGEAFPDLDLVMEANGVRVILVGKTEIKKGITTTTFVTTPDAPVSSITVNLPTGPHSALAANGNLCTTNLVLPTKITAQNGKVFKQNTNINVVNCGVQIVGQKTAATAAYLTIRTYAAGRISGSGSGFSTVAEHLNGATKSASLKVPLSGSALFKHRPFSLKVRVGFFPKKKGAPTSVAYTTVTFR